MVKKILHFFDKLEDKVRAILSRAPMVYAFLGGAGVVLFWRGIWHLADDFNLSSEGSLFLGSIILLITGVFVSVFIGNRLIISGLSGEKKLTEKTKEEIDEEEHQIRKLQTTLNKVEEKIDIISSEIERKH